MQTSAGMGNHSNTRRYSGFKYEQLQSANSAINTTVPYLVT